MTGRVARDAIRGLSGMSDAVDMGTSGEQFIDDEFTLPVTRLYFKHDE
jgi:hypothetical protein